LQLREKGLSDRELYQLRRRGRAVRIEPKVFDVLAFLIKRYYGSVAYGKIYGVIFGVFYLGSGLGIAGIAWFRQTFGNYNNGLFVAAGVLVASALLMVVLPAYRFRTGAEPAVQAAATPRHL
jgi:hypothetical protein